MLKFESILIPEDFAQALSENIRAKGIFNSLPYSHQKEYIDWIEDAKNPDTRQRTIQQAILMILERQKNRYKEPDA